MSFDFEIEFPTVEDRLVEEVRQYFNSPEEIFNGLKTIIFSNSLLLTDYILYHLLKLETVSGS